MRPLRSARPPDSRAEEPVTTKELAELMLKGPATATAPGGVGLEGSASCQYCRLSSVDPSPKLVRLKRHVPRREC